MQYLVRRRIGHNPYLLLIDINQVTEILHIDILRTGSCIHNNTVCTPDRTRTYYPQLRRLLLYPDELRAHAINESQK